MRVNSQNSFNCRMSGWECARESGGRSFSRDRDSVSIRIAFPFKSYIGAQGTSADEKNDQGISTAQLLALLSP